MWDFVSKVFVWDFVSKVLVWADESGYHKLELASGQLLVWLYLEIAMVQ